jgi:hypothetical protein
VNLGGKATLAIVVPWDNLFGHSFPRGGEEFDIQCEMETGDGAQRATGHFKTTEVTRFRKLELIGH